MTRDAVPLAVEQKRLEYFSLKCQIEIVQMAFGVHFIGTMKTQVTCRINHRENNWVFFTAGWYISVLHFYIPI